MKKTTLILMAVLALLLAGCAKDPAAPGVTPEPVLPGTEASAAQPVPDMTPEPMPAAPAPDGMEALSFADAAEKIRMDDDAVYLFVTNVGKGDALILRVGDWIGLIDTGKTWARGRVETALRLMGAGDSPTGEDDLDGVFLTHTDDDHIGGLRWMTADHDWLTSRSAGTVYAPAMYTGVKAEKHPALEAAQALTSGEVHWLRRGDEISLNHSGALLKVLAPASLYQDKDDNNSLVMMLESAQGRILLAGDMELPEEAELLGFGDDLRCDVVKVANHGDDDTTSAEFAAACAAQVALISTSGQEKPGTPDPGVISRLKAAGSEVFVTENRGLGILVTLKAGTVALHYVTFPDQMVSGLAIDQVDASDDRIVLKNTGGSAIDLGGMYLYSDKGNELFVFPQGARIDPDGTFIVGTNSTKGDFDLLWDDKKVVNRKKADVFYLYDAWGRLIDWMENGI